MGAKTGPSPNPAPPPFELPPVPPAIPPCGLGAVSFDGMKDEVGAEVGFANGNYWIM